MARRKKEPESCHRQRIAQAAEELFAVRGIPQTTMDHIAAAAKYSKATLYVYFKNKEEIVGELTLASMKMLRDHICAALEDVKDTKGKYDALCSQLIAYRRQYPYYFETALQEIPLDYDRLDIPSVEREIFAAGEEINRAIGAVLAEGVERGELREDIPIVETVFLFWASLSGLILMADRKEEYLERIVGISKEEFLKNGCNTLYQAIKKT